MCVWVWVRTKGCLGISSGPFVSPFGSSSGTTITGTTTITITTITTVPVCIRIYNSTCNNARTS
jgi:hypothetical protein